MYCAQLGDGRLPFNDDGRSLSKTAEKIAVLGEKPLSRHQLEREIARHRGGLAQPSQASN